MSIRLPARPRRFARALVVWVTAGVVVVLTAALAQAVPASLAQTSGMVDFPGASGAANSVSVRTIAEAGNRVWVGGIFTEIDDSNGDKVADASGLAVFDRSTGLLPAGVHIPLVTSGSGPGIVYDSSLGPDGNLYVAGVFDKVDGVARKNVAAIDPGTGALLPFATNSAAAYAILATSTAVYVGNAKLQSYQLNGTPTPGWNTPTVSTNPYPFRAHTTPAQFRDIVKQGATLVATCQCDSLQDADGTARTVKAVVQIDATTGAWIDWRPGGTDPKRAGYLSDASAAFGITAFVHDAPGTTTPTVYLAAGGSDFTAAYDFTTGIQRFKTDTSGSSQTIVWYQGELVVGGHFEWTQSPTANACGSNASPNYDCYYSPKLVAMDASTGAILLDADGSPWNPGLCCKYNGVWALLVDADGSTLHVGGEFTWAGGTWICPTFNGTCLTGRSTHRFYTRLAGPPAGMQSLTVDKLGTGSGTVTSSPGGIGCGTICSGNFASGATVTLAASAARGSTFEGWSGGGCSGTGTCVVTMAQLTTVSATFTQPTERLTVQTNGTSAGLVTSSPVGIDCGLTCAHDFPVGQVVTLTAVTSGTTAFSGWSGGGCTGTALTCQVPMDAAKTVTATFDVGYKVTVHPAGTGMGTVTSAPGGIDCAWNGSATSGTCYANFAAGTSPVLTAVAGAGSTFSGWSNNGACSGTGTCTFSNLASNKSVTATFTDTQQTATLTVLRSGSGSGTVTSTPAGISCGTICSFAFPVYQTVTLTASPSGTSVFTGWSDGCSGTSLTCDISLGAAKTVTATFGTGYRVTVTPGGTGAGSVTSVPGGIACAWDGSAASGACSANFPAGSSPALTASANAGSTFSGWSNNGACSGTGTCTFSNLAANRSVTATFDAGGSGQTVQESDPTVTFDGWRGVTDAAASGGAYRVSTATSDKATWTSPVSTSVTWVTRKGPNLGIATVLIDGTKVGTVDLYASTAQGASFAYPGLTSVAHTVVVKVTGTKNAASSGSGVVVDAFTAAGATAQESATAVAYDTWTGVDAANASGGTYRWAKDASAAATFTFTGTSFDWITTLGPSYGKAQVTIDGVNMPVVNLYAASTQWRRALSYGGLSNGSHTVVIHVLGQKDAASSSTKVAIDAFVIHP